MLFIVFPFPRGFFSASIFFVFNSCAPSGGVIQAIQLSLFKAFGRMLLRTWFDFKLTDLLTRAIGMISMDIPWQVCIIMDSGFKIALEDVEIFRSICAWWEEEIDEAFQSDVVEVCFTLNCCGGADEQGDHRIIINHNTSLCSWLFLDTLFACMEFSLC